MVFKKDWIYIDFSPWIYINLSSPVETIKKLKKVFIPLKCNFRYGKYWYPVLWCSKPSRIQILTRDVMWKDKDYSPQFECPPYIWIHLFGFNLVWYWSLTEYSLQNDLYWEMALWYLYYHSEYKMKVPNITAAEKYWPWRDYKTHISTWNTKFLIDYVTKK